MKQAGRPSRSLRDAAAVVIDGKPTASEHFGYTDGFGNPEYLGVERSSQPGARQADARRNMGARHRGTPAWLRRRSGELPVAPVPASAGKQRHLHGLSQAAPESRNLSRLPRRAGRRYGARCLRAEKLAAKFIGRWRDGTPIELSPDKPDYSIAQDPDRSTNFTYGDDAGGTRCPIRANSSSPPCSSARRFRVQWTPKMERLRRITVVDYRPGRFAPGDACRLRR